MTDPTPSRMPPSGLVVRPCEAGDQELVIRIFEEGRVLRQDGFTDPGTDVRDLARHYLPPSKNRLWVADLGSIAAVGMIGVRPTGEHAAELCRLRVLTGYRNQGIGSALIEQALAYCREHAFLKLVLDAHVERTQAIRLFERFGFQLTREREAAGRPLLDFYLDLYRDPGASR